MHSNTENNENKQSESIRDYEVYEQIGKGVFSTVHRAVSKEKSQEVAIKIVKIKKRRN